MRRGHEVPLPPDKTFGELCDYWLEKRVPHKRSGKHDKRIISRHLRPAFGDRRLRELTVEDTDAFTNDQAPLDPKTIHNHLTLFIAMMHVAVDLRWLERVPGVKKPSVLLFDKDFSFLRSDDEVGRFLRAAVAEDEMVLVLYATAVYTGMRAGELAGLRWEAVSFERRLFTVARSFDGPTKSGEVRHVPMLDPLLAPLRAWRLRHGGDLVFTNRDGRMLQRSSRVFQEVLMRVLDRAGLPRRPNGRGYVRFHDLRHTFASHWMMRGGDLSKLQRILGHASPIMTNRYAHLAPEAYTADHGRLTDLCPTGTAVMALPVTAPPPRS